ncbi:MAG: class I SAM-dependent methyltransferase [Candidatus Micrarchaeota archaeon]|nr:class I SAM-dependent methyltransferase [Candidatus Micrarchaeota archaeon]
MPEASVMNGETADMAPRLSDMGRSAHMLRHDKSKWEYYWKRKPEGYRCRDTTQFIRDNHFEGAALCELGSGDRGDDREGALGPNYFGIDISFTASRKALKTHPRANIVNADIRMLPFREGAFDVVVAYEVMHNVGLDIRAAVAEMSRITRGLAIFNVSDRKNIPEEITQNRIKGHNWRCIELDCCLQTVPVENGRPNPDASVLYFSEEPLRKMVEGMGFERVVTQASTVRGRVVDVEDITVYAAKKDDMIKLV